MDNPIYDSDYSSDIELNSQVPLCTVDGFMSHPSLNCWKSLKEFNKKQKNPKKIINTSIGGVSSAYDSAINLFYQLKGGKVNYGQKHSEKHDHDQFGKEYEGFYLEWNELNPIHFICHSFGGNCVLLLQKLLDEQLFFDSNGQKLLTSSKWIKSITTISSPLKGSSIVYCLGYKKNANFINPFSIGSFIYKFCYLWNFFTTQFIREAIFDFQIDQFNLFPSSKNWIQNIYSLFKNIIFNNRFDNGKDNASSDISFDRFINNNIFETKPTIYYKSYATNINLNNYCFPLTLTSNLISNFLPSKDDNEFYNQFINQRKNWSKNDGIVPLNSQFHPDYCNFNYCFHSKTLNESKFIKRGKWYVTEVENCSHIDIIPGYFNSAIQMNVFLDYYSFLSKIES